MDNFLYFNIFIDKEIKQLFVPMFQDKSGIWTAVDYWRYYEKSQWEEIADNILDMIKWIKENNYTEVPTFNVFRKKGIKNFKAFSSKHINLVVIYHLQEKTFEIYNHPRLSDGSYGIETDIPQEYWQQHICGYDLNEIKQSIECAYEDGMRYLAYIGKTL